MNKPNGSPMFWVFGIVGGLLGAGLGYAAFDFLLGYGMYAMILPGALVGLGVSLASRRFSMALGIFGGAIALLLGVYLEWQYLPFAADESLAYFLKNILQINLVHLLMIIGGGFAGYWFGMGRESGRPTAVPADGS